MCASWATLALLSARAPCVRKPQDCCCPALVSTRHPIMQSLASVCMSHRPLYEDCKIRTRLFVIRKHVQTIRGINSTRAGAHDLVLEWKLGGSTSASPHIRPQRPSQCSAEARWDGMAAH